MEAPSLDLDITGMTCSACVRNVTRALDSVAGPGASRVELSTGRAGIRLSATAGTLAQLIAAVEEAGYGASPVIVHSPQ